MRLTSREASAHEQDDANRAHAQSLATVLVLVIE